MVMPVSENTHINGIGMTAPRKFRVRTGKYGFVLKQGFDIARATYYLNIMGKEHEISDSKYVIIFAPYKRIYLATNHNAAIFFAFLEKQSGRVKGNENWLHIDKYKHPDNKPTQFENLLSPSTDFDELRDNLNYFRKYTSLNKEGIHVANFMSGVAQMYPAMDFIFLHNDCKPGKSAADWGGMRFSKVIPLLECDGSLLNGRRNIMSIDLDLLGYASPLTDRTAAMMKEKLLMLAKESRLIMLFTSPGYMSHAGGKTWMEEMVNEIING